MDRALTFAICGALLALPCTASAESGFAERLRLHGGYTHLTRQAPEHDAWGGAIPEVSFFAIHRRSLLRLTYSFGLTVHSAIPDEVANRLELASAYDLSPRTTMLLSALVSQSSVTQSFVTQVAPETAFGIMPSARTQLVTGSISEATSWEASPVVRVDQQVSARYVTTLDTPAARPKNYLANATGSVERTFQNDAIGVLAQGGYAYSSLPSARDEQFISAALAPRWRHDISPTLTSSLAPGASTVVSPDPGTRAIVRPFGQASLSLFHDDSSFVLSYTGGPQANVITAQLLDAHQVMLRASIPLSIRYAITLGASAGYLHGERLDLRRDVVSPPSVDTILADAELTWSPASPVQLFARYQFFDQIDGVATAPGAPTSVLRNAMIAGVQLSSRPDGVRVPTTFPQRVDRSDARTPATPR